MAQFISMALRIVGLGAVLAMMSELWYYPVELKPDVLLICLFYGPIAYLAWLIAAQTRIRTWIGALWAAYLMGYLVEGIPVPFLFSALPFTIVWTSMAWHGIISVTLGLWAFRRIAATRSPAVMATFCFGLGAYVSLATVELWTMRTDGAPWEWAPLRELAVQWMAGWVLFVAGHVALDLASRVSTRPMRGELPVWGGIALFIFAGGQGIAFFPFSLVLPVLVALAWWVMARDGQGSHEPRISPFLEAFNTHRVSLIGYAASLLIPVGALGAYGVLQAADVRLEGSALHIAWAGPLALGLAVWSIWKVLRA